MGGLNEGGLENELGQRGSMVRVVDRLLLLFPFPFFVSFRFELERNETRFSLIRLDRRLDRKVCNRGLSIDFL